MGAVQAPPTRNNSNDKRTAPIDQNVPQARPHIRSKQHPPTLKIYLEEQVLAGNRPTQEFQETFAAEMSFFQMFRCDTCREKEGFLKVECRSKAGECKECEASCKKHKGMSCGNDMVPHPPSGNRYPKGLAAVPTQTEEMILARFFPIIRVYRLGNGKYGYKGLVLNVEQDASPIWSKMPVHSDQYPFLIVRKRYAKMPSNFRDFRVRRNVIYCNSVFGSRRM